MLPVLLNPSSPLPCSSPLLVGPCMADWVVDHCCWSSQGTTSWWPPPTLLPPGKPMHWSCTWARSWREVLLFRRENRFPCNVEKQMIDISLNFLWGMVW